MHYILQIIDISSEWYKSLCTKLSPVGKVYYKQRSNVKSHFALDSCLIYSMRQTFVCETLHTHKAVKLPPPAASKKALQFFSYTVQRKNAFYVRLLFDLQLSLELCMRNIVHTLKEGCRVKILYSCCFKKSSTILFI